ncbi:MAG: hypothetical protein KC656_22615, partial [Myxococcales bacterium]|nr:hypothetical protein [Myxococcales bacterium]
MTTWEVLSGAPAWLWQALPPQRAGFLEDELEALDGFAVLAHRGSLELTEAALAEVFAAHPGQVAVLVDGDLTVSGTIDGSGGHCLVVLGDLRCHDLYGDANTFVTATGDLTVERALISSMMSNAGIHV